MIDPMAPAADLVAAGFIAAPDYADALNPGPVWQAEIDARAAEDRRRRALEALGNLTPDDVTALLEAFRGA